MGISFDVVRGRGPIVLGDLARTLEDRLRDSIFSYLVVKLSSILTGPSARGPRSDQDRLCCSFLGSPLESVRYLDREVSSPEGFKESHGFLKETLQAGRN